MGTKYIGTTKVSEFLTPKISIPCTQINFAGTSSNPLVIDNMNDVINCIDWTKCATYPKFDYVKTTGISTLDLTPLGSNSVTVNNYNTNFTADSSFDTVDMRNVTGLILSDCLIFSWNTNVKHWLTSGSIFTITGAGGQFMWRSCTQLIDFDMSGWDWTNCTGCGMFWDTYALKTFIGDHTLAEVEAGTVTAFNGLKVDADNCTYSTAGALIRYSSWLAAAKGVADLTGETAHTFKIKTASWNNMYNDDDTIPDAATIAARQATLTQIFTDKNWNITLV